MKVIREGSVPNADKVYAATCPLCGTIIEFNKIETSDVPTADKGNYLQVNCPLPGCGCLINVKE